MKKSDKVQAIKTKLSNIADKLASFVVEVEAETKVQSVEVVMPITTEEREKAKAGFKIGAESRKPKTIWQSVKRLVKSYYQRYTVKVGVWYMKTKNKITKVWERVTALNFTPRQ